jgi:hypothetical protein
MRSQPGVLLTCLLLACQQTTSGDVEETGPPEPAEQQIPRLQFHAEENGVWQRRFSESTCSDIGYVWAEMLKDASIRKELELIADQEQQLVAAARSLRNDLIKYRAEVEEILLPHQIEQMRQIFVRYCCLTTGILQQLEDSHAFPAGTLSGGELQRVRASLTGIAKEYYTRSQRELKILDAEVRKTLTRAHLEAVRSLIGDRLLLEGPFLDFAVLRLETVTGLEPHRLDSDMNEPSAVLGRSTQYELNLAGKLQPAQNDTPVHFFSAFRNGVFRAQLNLTSEQKDLLLDFENSLLAEVSSRSKRVYQLLTDGEVSIEEAKELLNDIAAREVNRTVSAFDTMLTRDQQRRLDAHVLQRDLAQRGMLPILVEGRRIPIADDQQKVLRDIIAQKLKRFRELTRQTETRIWQAVSLSLGSVARQRWTATYGDGTRKALPVSPTLLLYERGQ